MQQHSLPTQAETTSNMQDASTAPVAAVPQEEAPTTPANPYLAKPDNAEVSAEDSASAAPSAAVAAATARAASLGKLVDQLTAVIAQENEQLEKPKSTELGPIVSRKQSLFLDYQQFLKTKGDLRAIMAELPPSEREALLNRAKLFDKVLRENESKLDAMVKSSQHIMGVISEVARKAAQPVRGYGAAGVMNQATRTVAPVAVNVTY